MTAVRDVIPPPRLEHLQKLQLMRFTLVKFIDWKNFEEVIQGCFVRVLLEMRSDRHQQGANPGADSYYIAAVKGAQKGPSYTGFSWDGLSTEWHIVIELPPCFRSTPNNNVVQFNSISNSTFKPKEYDEWISMTKEASRGFITAAQIDLRLALLHEHFHASGTPQGAGNRRGRGQAAEDPAKAAIRATAVAALHTEAEAAIRAEHVFLPLVDSLTHMKADQLLDVQRECLDLAARLRLLISERSKCLICKTHAHTVVCYPCKHQVSCAACAQTMAHCPAPGCGAVVSDKFEPFTA
jgi:hypothetical protein